MKRTKIPDETQSELRYDRRTKNGPNINKDKDTGRHEEDGNLRVLTGELELTTCRGRPIVGCRVMWYIGLYVRGYNVLAADNHRLHVDNA